MSLAHGLHLHEYAHSLHDQHHRRGRGLHELHLEDVAGREGIQGVHGGFQQRHRVLEVVLAGVSLGLHAGGFGFGVSLLLRDGRLHLVSLDRLLRDDLHGSLGILLRLHQLRLERDELQFHSLDALFRGGELLQSVDVTLLLGVNLFLLLLEQVFIGTDELEVGRGGDVEVPPGLGEVPFRQRDGPAVHLDAHLSQRRFEFVRYVDVFEKLLRDVEEGIFRPGGEPVDRGARDQRRELAKALAEGVADGGEGEHDVEVLFNLLDEKVVHQVFVRVHASLLRPAPDVLEDGHHVAALHQVRNLPGVEQVGDVLDEVLVLDLRVGEQKHRVFVSLTREFHNLLQVVVPLHAAVRLGQLNLVNLKLLDVRREPRERLPPTPADAHEQRVPAGLRDDAADAAHVLQRVQKQHQVHGLLTRRVEVHEVLGDHAVQLIVLEHLAVHLGVRAGN